jgi:chorismate dehydratase
MKTDKPDFDHCGLHVSKPLRVGAVSYLNTKPLVFGLQHTSQLDLIFDLPSRLADQLAAGELDVALIPSVEFFQDERYSIVSDACIACRGPVWSVKLLSRVPMSKIRTLALDEGSRTSAALVRILLQQRFGLDPETSRLPIGDDATSAATDAVLLIGDRAMHMSQDDFKEVWDLGAEWCRWSDLPFVFAMWVAREGVHLGDLARTLEEARDQGVRNLEEIVAREAAVSGLTNDACLGYLRDNLHFYLGPSERRGLELFRRHASQFGFAPREVHCQSASKFNGLETLPNVTQHS